MATSQQGRYQRDIRMFSYSVMAYVYKNSHISFTPPGNMKMDYEVPNNEAFIEVIGKCVLRLSKRFSDHFQIICQLVVDYINHDEGSFVSYFMWRCQSLDFSCKGDILSLCALTSTLVLHYFRNGCFYFSKVAAETLIKIALKNQMLYNCITLTKDFIEFCLYCESIITVIDDDESYSSLNRKPESFEGSIYEFPKRLLDVTKHPIVYEITPRNATSKDANSEMKIVCIIPKERTEGAGPSSTVDFTPSFSSSEKYAKNSLCTNYSCNLCHGDCREFLEIFVEKFKREFC